MLDQDGRATASRSGIGDENMEPRKTGHDGIFDWTIANIIPSLGSYTIGLGISGNTTIPRWKRKRKTMLIFDIDWLLVKKYVLTFSRQ